MEADRHYFNDLYLTYREGVEAGKKSPAPDNPYTGDRAVTWEAGLRDTLASRSRQNDLSTD